MPKYHTCPSQSVMKVFEIKAYTKKELALSYFPQSSPHTAVNHLMAWIVRNRSLIDVLAERGCQKTSKWFSPRQVEAIIAYLGEP